MVRNGTIGNGTELVPGIPGLNSGIFNDNFGPHYMAEGDAAPGIQASPQLVAADITSSFTLLLAIFFPSVTGIMAGSNRSGDLKDASRSIPKVACPLETPRCSRGRL